MTNDPTRLRKRSVTIAGHATSVSMEDAFWTRLATIAEAEGKSVAKVIRDVDNGRDGNLSSALRVYILENS